MRALFIWVAATLLIAGCGEPSQTQQIGPFPEGLSRFTGNTPDGAGCELWILRASATCQDSSLGLSFSGPFGEWSARCPIQRTGPVKASFPGNDGKPNAELEAELLPNGHLQVAFRDHSSGKSVDLDLSPVPDALSFVPICYQVVDSSGSAEAVDEFDMGGGSISLQTIRVTRKSDGSRHPLDSLLESRICGRGSNYERFTTVDPEHGLDGSKDVSVGLSLVNEAWVVLSTSVSEYSEGAAHGMYGTWPINFALTTNKEVKLVDIVPKQNLDKLKAIARDELKATNPEHDFKNFPFDLAKDMMLMEHELILVYQPYEIGPFSEGEISIRLPYERIADLLDKNHPLTARLLGH